MTPISSGRAAGYGPAVAPGPELVAVGSTNPAKVEPIEDVLRRLFRKSRVQSVGVDSGVRPQPLSLQETQEGAEARARLALEAVPGAKWGIGVEGGIHLDEQGRGWLVTVAAVADRRGAISTGEGLRLMLPEMMVRAARAGRELADVVDEYFGVTGSRIDPGAVGHLTRGLITRRQLVAVAVTAALVPRLFPDLYLL
ncbi:MAG: inosine/xanthosine triphosphatase [Bacillota bacterium]